MRIFYAFLVMLIAVILFLLPVTTAVYAFRTDLRTDTFNNVTTNVTGTSANVTLLRVLYDNDTETITILSDTSSDTPAFSSYNSTNRLLVFNTLAANTTRTITTTYDIDALPDNAALDTLMDWTPFLWYVCCVAFVPAALVSIFWQRGE